MVTLTHKCSIVCHICGTHKILTLDFDNDSYAQNSEIIQTIRIQKNFFKIPIGKFFEKLSKSKKKKFVCTTYVAYYTTFVGQSYHICGILYHIRGILYHNREFPGNPYTDKCFQPFQYSTTQNLENIITSGDGFH